MVYAVEAWTFPTEESPAEEEMLDAAEFGDEAGAQAWAWARLQEGYAVRLWLR